MKLELKHLMPYLPYKIESLKGNVRVKITAVCLELPHIYHTTYLGSRRKEVSLIEEIKPILRPLSDLTKEIEVNGEKFIPEEYLNNNCEYYYLPNDWNAVLFIQIENIKSAPLAVIEKLLEWHFDIFGLIKNGLAISMDSSQAIS